MTREHSRDLADPSRSIEFTGAGTITFASGLDHGHLAVRCCSHLCEMRDDQHLAVKRYLIERPSQHEGGRPSDTGIDLIEDHACWTARQNESECQHQPSKFAARRNRCHGLECMASVGTEQQLNVFAPRTGDSRMMSC